MSVSRLLTAWTGGSFIAYDTTTTGTRTAVFASNGALDSADLVSWAAGHNIDAQNFLNQTNVTNQGMTTANGIGSAPRVITAGSYLGGLQFDGTSDGFVTGTSYPSSSVATIFLRGNIRSVIGSTVNIILEHTTNLDISNAFAAAIDSSARMLVGNHKQSPAGYSISYFNGMDPSGDVQCYRLDRSQANSNLQNVMFRDGAKETRTSSLDTGTFPTGAFSAGALYLGARAGTSLYANLDVHTLLVYNAALSDADCTAISNIISALP
jgi:hypothetical protein